MQLVRRAADDPDEFVVVSQPIWADREGDPAREPVVQLIVRSGLQQALQCRGGRDLARPWGAGKARRHGWVVPERGQIGAGHRTPVVVVAYRKEQRAVGRLHHRVVVRLTTERRVRRILPGHALVPAPQGTRSGQREQQHRDPDTDPDRHEDQPDQTLATPAESQPQPEQQHPAHSAS